MLITITHQMIRLTLLLGIYMLVHVRATHFRGGYITWKPVEGTTMINITYRIAWSRSSSGNNCNASSIESSTTISGEGKLLCRTCSPPITIIEPMSYRCVDFSEANDWMSGENSVLFNYTLADSDSFYVGYSTCCWLYLENVGFSALSVMAMIDTTLRDRNGVMRINNSPITAFFPVTNLILHCEYTIVIPVFDMDGDVTRCRWAVNNGDINECGSSTCSPVPGATLLEEECKLIFEAETTGYFRVSIQIEDFLSTSDTTPRSSVPLQFLLYVLSSSTECSAVPTFSQNTIADGTSVNITIGTTFQLHILVNSRTDISELTTASPASNLAKTPVRRFTTDWLTSFITWKPTAEQAGYHIFCFSALDVNGVSGEQRCVYLLVAGACFKNGKPGCSGKGFNVNSYTCDPQSGGVYKQCVKLPPYDDFQVAYCIKADDVIKRANNTIRCADSCRTYCYLTCMAETDGNHNLPEVTSERLCNTSYTTDAETQLSSWCLNPQGNCNFYNDCIPNRLSGCGHVTGLMSSLKDQCLWFADQYSKQECPSKTWISGVRKCFQNYLITSIFRADVTICSDVTYTLIVQAYEICFSDSTQDVQFCELSGAFRSDFKDELVPLIPINVQNSISTLLDEMASC